jgi:hypothetical protein
MHPVRFVPFSIPATDELTLGSDADADVIPITASAVVDMDLSKLTPPEIMASGLENLADTVPESPYAVRHGSKPVPNFPPLPNAGTTSSDHEYFERTFPCLFPWGEGGFYRQRPVPLDFREHVQWALQYADHRFRLHETFPFVVFSIVQRRQALASAKIQIKTQRSQKDFQLLRTVTVQKLRHAQSQEEAGQEVTDSTVQLLRKHVRATLGRVMGSDQSRNQMRSQIWSTTMCKGPPSLWMTINPSDLHDPIAQVFAGEDVDLNRFMKCMGPNSHRRAQNIAKDPFAASEYFHFIINTILETLFKVKVTKFQVHSGKGVLGQVEAYFGMKEVQGRGTIHLHILLWFKNTPSPDQLLFLLHQDEFRQKIREYLAANVRAFVPSMETSESIKEQSATKDVAFTRPPHPDSPDYDVEVRRLETKLACAEQVHVCKLRRCLVPDNRGRYHCKRRAPFECAPDDYVTPDGKCGPKRLHPFVNAWNPAVLVNCRCNNDVKFLTNGSDTKNISYYITMYATKKQGKSYNLSAVMARGLAYHLQHPNPAYLHDLRKAQSSLLFRLEHSINLHQEIAATLAMTLLMGRGEAVRSHSYSTIFWSSFIAHLISQCPEFRGSLYDEQYVQRNVSLVRPTANLHYQIFRSMATDKRDDRQVCIQHRPVSRLPS